MNDLLPRVFPRRPGPLAVLLALIAAVLTAAVTSVVVPTTNRGYVSTALVSLDAPREIALARDNGILSKVSGVRYKYTGLVQTDVIAAPVAQELGVPIQQVRGRLSAVASPADLLMRLSCTGSDAQQSKRCANALSTAMVGYVTHEQTTNGIPLILQLTAAPVASAGPGLATGTRSRRVLAISLLVGALSAALVLGVAAQGGAPAARPRR